MEREDMGILPTDEARAIAREESMDLVCISPDADPPVCRLMSFSKYKYEAERATKQRQKASKGCAWFCVLIGGGSARQRGCWR